MGSVSTAVADAAPAPQLGEDTAALRRVMVERQLRPYGVADLPVLERFLAVPREYFLPSRLAPIAYSDLAVSAGGAFGDDSRALLAPLVLAKFLEAAEIRPQHKVLDIAGGGGYSAALLSALAGATTALETDSELANAARDNLSRIGVERVRVVAGPLNLGAPDGAPYDVILIYGGVERGLEHLFEQLAPDGRLVAFKRPRPGAGMRAVAFDRVGGKPAGERFLFDANVPVLAAFAEGPEFKF